MGNCILREAMLKMMLPHILIHFVVCKDDDGLGWLFTTSDLIDAEPPKPGMPISAPLARQSPRDLRIPAQLMTPGIDDNTFDAPSDNFRVCPNDRVCLKGQYCDQHYEICRDKVPIGHPCRRDEMCQPGKRLHVRLLPAKGQERPRGRQVQVRRRLWVGHVLCPSARPARVSEAPPGGG
ncbi:uncharacterized protein [Macrobrachium rosenbergii]|uniref:uncharacterized protein n=1 Tax=Macrobrachium rosenbergii TaxID=79674 RepID=UPI0034D3B704